MIKNQIKINQAIQDIMFELNLSEVKLNKENPKDIQDFLNDIHNNEEHQQLIQTEPDAKAAVEKLQALLDEHNAQECKVGKEEIKAVFKKLQNRELHPKGTWDKRGRFYLEDDELVDVCAPSAAYPHSQMLAGRTRKFVEAMANKYRVQSQEELEALFKKAKSK